MLTGWRIFFYIYIYLGGGRGGRKEDKSISNWNEVFSINPLESLPLPSPPLTNEKLSTGKYSDSTNPDPVNSFEWKSQFNVVMLGYEDVSVMSNLRSCHIYNATTNYFYVWLHSALSDDGPWLWPLSVCCRVVMGWSTILPTLPSWNEKRALTQCPHISVSQPRLRPCPGCMSCL